MHLFLFGAGIYFLKENMYTFMNICTNACVDLIQVVDFKHIQKDGEQKKGRDVSAHNHITMMTYIYIFPHSVDVWTLNQEKLPCRASPMTAEPLLKIPHGEVGRDQSWAESNGLDIKQVRA